MITTNSLGSNYDLDFIRLTQLVTQNSDFKSEYKQLLATLDDLYSGTAFLFYKGRHAISAALQYYGLGEGDFVLTQAFTCYAVEEAITNTKAQPIYVDTDTNSLNLSLPTIKQAYNKASTKPKALIIQHTLGYPIEILPIKNWCQQHNLILIEDLAHAAGATYDQSHFTGHFADAIALSFGRDKIIDAITGGALIIKTKSKNQSKDKTPTPPQAVSDTQITKLLNYPLITSKIRESSPLFGKLLHRFYLLTGKITSPIADQTDPLTPLPAKLSPLVLKAIDGLSISISKRRQIATIYHHTLKTPSTIIQDSDISTGACLRYPLVVKNRNKLFQHLKRHHFHIGDTWYNQPVATGKLNLTSQYQPGSCPNAEKLSSSIINLPTHAHIKEPLAQQLVQLINDFNN